MNLECSAGEWPDRIARPTLETREDVEEWFRLLLEEGRVNFHPEDDFTDIVTYGTGGERSFSDEEGESMNRAMERAYTIVGDACEVAVKVFRKWEETG